MMTAEARLLLEMVQRPIDFLREGWEEDAPHLPTYVAGCGLMLRGTLGRLNSGARLLLFRAPAWCLTGGDQTTRWLVMWRGPFALGARTGKEDMTPSERFFPAAGGVSTCHSVTRLAAARRDVLLGIVPRGLYRDQLGAV